MNMFLSFVFIFTTVAFQNAAMAGCDQFNLVQAQEVLRVIAQNKNSLYKGEVKEANKVHPAN